MHLHAKLPILLFYGGYLSNLEILQCGGSTSFVRQAWPDPALRKV